MSKITGVLDFKDFVQQEDKAYLKKLNIYIGYFNYIIDNPIDTKDFNSPKDWAPLYQYTILTKSLYRDLGMGYVVLSERDFISEQEDKLAGSGFTEATKKLIQHRQYYTDALMSLGYTDEESQELARYHFELEPAILSEKEGENNG